MSWLIRQISSLFDGLWSFLARILSWFCDSIVWLFNRVANSVTLFVSGLLGMLAGVMPAETLAGTWQSVFESLTWLDGWPAYLATNAFAFDFLLARLSYLGVIFAAAMVARGVFTGVKALLELL